MARKPREYGPSGIYHVVIRGNNNQNIFFSDQDKIFFKEQMKKYAQELEIEIYAYCLMSNHVHILIGNSNKTMSKFMQKLETSYAKKFNRKYERHGHVFNDRFLSKNIDDDERFKTVIRYILQNPMKAGMCDNNEYLSDKLLVPEKVFYEKYNNKSYLLTKSVH